VLTSRPFEIPGEFKKKIIPASGEPKKPMMEPKLIMILLMKPQRLQRSAKFLSLIQIVKPLRHFAFSAFKTLA